MKQNDIFGRLNKRADIPVSLFPCSSMHRTSMKIGRAVPLYSINMFAGNRIELSASQLTRFATLDKPVMNNYEVNMGFYFVPWTAHDEMGTSAWFRKNIGSNDNYNGISNVMKNYKLNANEFFNPAFDNALRHHPIMVKMKSMGLVRLVGSLYDHLGYYVGSGNDYTSFNKWYAYSDTATSGSTDGTFVSLDDLTGGTPLWADFTGSSVAKGKLVVLGSNANPAKLQFTDRGVMPLDLFVFAKYYRGVDTDNYSWSTLKGLATSSDYLPTNPVNSKVYAVIHNALSVGNDKTASVPSTWKDYFGNLLPAACLNAYAEYLNSMAAFFNNGNFALNCLDWLNYMRIYADWFLNDHYTRRDDFLDMIGAAYYGACASDASGTAWTIPQLFAAGSQAYHYLPANGNGKLKTNPELQFFADYIARGECLPVLWELNRYTAQRCEVDIQNLAGLTDTSSALSPADTAVGSTIREHFFNRAVQKFKDLISRVGYDFKNNSKAIYGAGPDDAILNRSQLIAIKSFPVNVGDVQQTSESSMNGSLGDFGGFAFSKNGTDVVSWEAKQNGTFMVLCWIRPRNVAYANGVDREKMKNDYLDYLIPTFGGVGYQDVLVSEVFAAQSVGTLHDNGRAFGKEEIFSEYMSKPNYCTGSMRTFNRTWHSDRFFSGNAPVLGKGLTPKFLYITEDDNVDRIFSNQIDDPILLTAYFKGNITRQLPSRIKTDF